MTGSPLTIDREVRPRVEEEEPMRVPVRVLRAFEGAIDERGLRARLFEPSEGVITLPEGVAALHAANGNVEVVEDADVDEDGNIVTASSDPDAYDVEFGEDGLPAAGTPHAAVLEWLTKATGRPLLAWLAKRNVKVERGTRVPQIREQAIELAKREEAQIVGKDPTPEEAAGTTIDPDTLAITVGGGGDAS